MFKEFLRGITHFFTTDKVMILAVFLVLVLGFSMYSGTKTVRFGASGSAAAAAPATVENMVSQPAEVSSPVVDVVGSASSSNVTNASDLLPLDQNTQWAALNPVNAGNAALPDLLQAGYHIGLDTIGQTLRNPNYQLRSDPIIPKVEVGPWNQSTIEGDYGRVPLEIGSCR